MRYGVMGALGIVTGRPELGTSKQGKAGILEVWEGHLLAQVQFYRH